MMKLCPECRGSGCERCDYEGIDSEVTFTKKKIVRKNTMNYQEYQIKKERELSKIDKKNSREEF